MKKTGFSTEQLMRFHRGIVIVEIESLGYRMAGKIALIEALSPTRIEVMLDRFAEMNEEEEISVKPTKWVVAPERDYRTRFTLKKIHAGEGNKQKWVFSSLEDEKITLLTADSPELSTIPKILRT
jgi:hypothetical protein